MMGLSFRKALIGYAIFFLALTFPYWGLGEVVAPHGLSFEIAAPEISDAGRIENREFFDYARGYIPQLTGLLNGQRSGWLALWNNQNELGRPLIHGNGFSPAYLPTRIIAAITGNPYRVFTLLSLGLCFLAGLFVLMLCRELHLSPMGGLLAASSLAASPPFMWWLTPFPMFIATICWSAGAVYAVTRISNKIDLPSWCLLAFSIYSLLMMGHPQSIVHQAYFLCGYSIYTVYCHRRSKGARSTFLYLVASASAVGIGGLLALPVYLDIAHAASESARNIAPDISFFTFVLPGLDSLPAVLRFLALGTFPEIFGNPISSSYPLPYKGLSTTPLIVFLSLLALFLCLRKTWGWWLAIFFFCALTFIYPLFVFAVQYLGFNLSRSSPLAGIIIPLTIIMAYGADALLQRVQARHIHAVWLAALGTLLCLFIAIWVGVVQGLVIHWGVVAITLGVIGLLAAQLDISRPGLLIASVAIVAAYLSFPMMLRITPTQITGTSPLVEKMLANLPPDSRYAVASPGLTVLLPDINAGSGLASIHSYNSLTSRRYHTLINALGGEMQNLWRWNQHIAPDYAGAMFWMSNISLVLSPLKLEHKNLSYIGNMGNVHFYRVVSRMGAGMQVVYSQAGNTSDGIYIADPRLLTTQQTSKTVDRGDLLEFDVQGDQSSLLILSRQFHRDWLAMVRTASGWEAAGTVAVNDVFQGVLLPEGAQKVRLEFLPYVRFAWLAHIFWLFMLAALIYRAIRLRGSASAVGERS